MLASPERCEGSPLDMEKRFTIEMDFYELARYRQVGFTVSSHVHKREMKSKVSSV